MLAIILSMQEVTKDREQKRLPLILQILRQSVGRESSPKA
jgi:hypothetical protein